jgi:hypothetical protein
MKRGVEKLCIVWEVLGIEVFILLGAFFFLPSVAPASQQDF